MLSIDWRTPAAYRHTKDLPAAGFAWEYLRRNNEYRQEYMALAARKQPAPGHLEAFVERWGVRFPKQSRRAA
jgi:hypothetical protein